MAKPASNEAIPDGKVREDRSLRSSTSGIASALPRNDGLRLPPAVAEPLSRSWTKAEAFAYCSALTKAHYENFPVGSLLAPKSLQPDIHSLYAFMRTADDFSDENRRPGDDQERLAYLQSWDQLLTECEQGQPRHPVFIALRDTLDRHALPVQWLRDLLHAFTLDCMVRRYKTYDDVLAYCRYSANPVGRLILTLFGYRSEELYTLSDEICTGLQLANHWQDVAVDAQKDRIYLPQEDLKQFGVTEDWILQTAKPHPASGHPLPMGEGHGASTLSHRERGDPPMAGGEAAFRDLMAFQVSRTRELFQRGKSLPSRVHGRLRMELAMTWKGGACILDKIEKVNYNVFNHRPVVTKWDWLWLTITSIK